MNQEVIGRFISSCRKEKGLTQKQLAEKLNITDRAVSKWENGKSTPDASIMLDLCEILGITANELLSGERISMEMYQKKADENIVALKKKNEFFNMSAKTGFSVTFVLLLIINFVDAYEYGVETAISMPAFRIMISVTFTWLLIYLYVLIKKRR